MKKLSWIEKLLSLFLCATLITSAFALEIKQSATTPIYVLLVNTTDGYTETTGVSSPIIYYTKAGGAATNLSSPEWTEINATNMPGLYRLNTTSDMTDTVGELVVYAAKVGSRTFKKTIDIVANLESDSYAQSDIINATVASVNGTATAVKAQTDKLQFDASNYTKSTPQTNVTVDTNNDKTGYSLSQGFPGNFSSLLITSAGKVTVGTNDDKTGYTASTVSDKTGYSLASAQSFNLTGNITGNLSGSVGSVTALSAAAIQSIWDALTSALTTAGSIGKRIVDYLDAAVSSRSTLGASDVWSYANRTLTESINATIGAGDISNITGGVWNATMTNYNGTGTMGNKMNALLTSGTGDWTNDEKEQLRDALGINGTKITSINGTLQRIDKNTRMIR